MCSKKNRDAVPPVSLAFVFSAERERESNLRGCSSRTNSTGSTICCHSQPRPKITVAGNWIPGCRPLPLYVCLVVLLVCVIETSRKTYCFPSEYGGKVFKLQSILPFNSNFITTHHTHDAEGYAFTGTLAGDEHSVCSVSIATRKDKVCGRNEKLMSYFDSTINFNQPTTSNSLKLIHPNNNISRRFFFSFCFPHFVDHHRISPD